MKKEWIKIIPQIIENLKSIEKIKCPNCGKCGIDYMYTGDENTRIGFLQIWCTKCFKGIYINRAIASPNSKFISFDSESKDLIQVYDFVED